MGLRGSPLGYRREHVDWSLGGAPQGLVYKHLSYVILESCLSAVALQEPGEPPEEYGKGDVSLEGLQLRKPLPFLIQGVAGLLVES